MFDKRRILISRSFSTYFTIPGVKKIVRYTKDFWRFVLSRFHCTIRLAHKSSSKFFSSAKRKLELFLPELETRSEGLRERLYIQTLFVCHTNIHAYFIVSSPKGLVPDALLPVLTSVEEKKLLKKTEDKYFKENKLKVKRQNWQIKERAINTNQLNYHQASSIRTHLLMLAVNQPPHVWGPKIIIMNGNKNNNLVWLKRGKWETKCSTET